MAIRHRVDRTARFLASAAVIGCIAISAAGCVTTGLGGTAGPLAARATPTTDADWRREADAQGARYRANQGDPDAAVAYARALDALGERVQAASVLQQASMRNPANKAVLGAYGRELAAVGKYAEALDVLSRAHSPDQPDWRILSAQGAVLDQMGNHQEAQRYYSSALKIVPDEPSVLSNLGLSYALSKDLPKAETTLRRAVERPGADPRVRQNLALVVGLQGRFTEAEAIARADLPPEQAAANVAYLQQMMSDHDDLASRAADATTASKPAGKPKAAKRPAAAPDKTAAVN
ncbi:MAG TPA: tetratricopeptide repeat protein [Xanthobacteraceae bacterium]|nr:tetratricopeptide repeat protein [Xanthobacteraceae bacterium]